MSVSDNTLTPRAGTSLGRLLVHDLGSSLYNQNLDQHPNPALHRPWLSNFSLGSRRQLPRGQTQRANQRPQKWQSGRVAATASPLPRLDIDGECSRPTSWPHDGESIRQAICAMHIHLDLFSFAISLPVRPPDDRCPRRCRSLHCLWNCASLVARKTPAMAFPGRFIYKPQNVVYPACPGICGRLESGEHGHHEGS